MPRTLPKPRSLPKIAYLSAGPIVGVCDSTDPTTADPTKARGMINMMRRSGPAGGAVVGRPGTAQMGAALSGVVQAGAETWTLSTGVRQTVAVHGGEVSTYDWVTNAWTKVITAANLATAGAVLSSTARVALVPFAERLVITDGVNFALWWNGVSGAGGIIKLPVKFYGRPTVYYSKLCGVDATDRLTMFWSEEGDAALGYGVTVGLVTYTNVWDNPGGYADPLVVVTGTNDGLYVQRERNSLAILGAMGPDFKTAGTRSNLSADVGTLSPWGVLVIDQGVFFVDADAQPWVMKIGVGLSPLWKDCAELLRDVPRLSMVNTTVVYDEADGVIVAGVAATGQLGVSRWLVFTADDLQYQGFWAGWAESLSAGTVIDQFGVKRWSHANKLGGRIVAHGSPQSGPWSDSVAGVTVPVAHELTSPFLGYDPSRAFYLSLANVGFTAGTGVTVGYQTSYGYGTFNPFTLTATNVLQFILGSSLLGTGILGSQVFSSQVTAGLFGMGRWASLIVRHTVLNEPFGVDVLRLTIGYAPGNPRQP